MTITLRPHQTDALSKMRDGCILAGGVGSGKSITAVKYYEKNHFPKDVYVITTAKKRDGFEWDGEFARIAVSRDPDISYKKVMLVVDSWNQIGEYINVKDAFFIFDEQRLVGSGAWVKSFYKIAKQNSWIMLSATPGDSWMEYIPVMVANGFYKNKTDFVRRHVIFSPYTKYPKVDRYVETGYLEKVRNYLLVDMPYEKHTVRHLERVSVGFDQELFQKAWKDRWHIYEERPLRDVSELFIVGRKVVNTFSGRLEEVVKLHKKHPKLIIFYNFDYELEKLRELSTLGVPVAEWNGHKHERIPESDSWVYLVQYTAGAEGWNCIETDAVIFYSLNYSYKIFEQAQGRIDRLTTPFVDLYYYILMSDSIIDKAIWRSLRAKKSFNERKFVQNL